MQMDDSGGLQAQREILIQKIDEGDYCRTQDHDCGACPCEEITDTLRHAWSIPCPLCGEAHEPPYSHEECPMCGAELSKASHVHEVD